MPGTPWENPVRLSFRGTAGDEESRRLLKTLRARFLAALGMTGARGIPRPTTHPTLAPPPEMLLNEEMITQQQYESVVGRASQMLAGAGIILTQEERARFEVADFGLGELEKTGLEIITYINTDRVCAKELVLLPHQTCPEHRHPTVDNRLGKEETFRCRWGTVYLYVPGPAEAHPACRPPVGSEAYYTVSRQIRLKPGEQYTLFPDTLHWFQAGPQGAIVSEFSTRSTDDQDVFTDPRIKRAPEIASPTR